MESKSLSRLVIWGVFSILSPAHAQQPAISSDTTRADRAAEQSTAPSPSAGTALIYVYRDGSTLGAAGYDRIFVNADYLAALHRSNFAQREVPPGTVVFTTLSRLNKIFIAQAELMTLQKKAKERFRMDVEAGKTYYVKWSVGGKMKLVDAATGAKEMRGSHPAKD